MHKVENEIRLAEQELIALLTYISSFLNTVQAAAFGHNRLRRAAQFAVMALASVG